MLGRVTLAGLVLVGACAGDPWPGTYEGTRTSDGRLCDGTALPVDVRADDVTLERGTAGLFTSGLCLFTYEELNATTARAQPASCDTTAADGTPIHVELVNGEAMLDGDELTLTTAIDLTSPDPDLCATTTSTFIGIRR